MPFLGFVSGRRSSSNASEANNANIASIKEQFRKVSSKGPSSISVHAGHLEDYSHMDPVKHHSTSGKLKPERKSSHNSPKIAAHKPARLWLTVESPPLVSYNIPTNSSGALFSAQLHLDVADSEVTFESVTARIVCVVTVKKPVHPGCAECASKTTELKSIDLTRGEILKLKRGDHPIPVSYLFPGHLPATTQCALGSVEYFVIADAKLATGETIRLSQKTPMGDWVPVTQGRHHVKLARSILPGNDKHSIRVFPPTNLTASVTLNPIVYPIGEFEVDLRLSGMNTVKQDSTSRWRLRKMNWRIEEKCNLISPACSKHAQKLGGEGRGIAHEDVRTIGEGNLDQQKNAWKNDFDAGDAEAIFMCSINPSKKPTCDAEAQNGLAVSHTLVVEMVVAEEWSPKGKPFQITPTGAARILRTQFNLILTERPGLGVSWDEETPPVYEDVPESPPHYASNVEFDIESLGGSVEELHLDPNTNQLLSVAASSSTSRPRSSGSNHANSSQSRSRLNVDDLLSGPPERRESVQEDEEEEDVQIVEAPSVTGRR